MLNKIIKVDLRFILKAAPIFFGVGGFLAVSSLVLSKMNGVPILDFIQIFAQNSALSLAFGGLVNVLMRGFVNFRIKLYSDQSYLTHTIPVSRRIIYYSKFLSAAYSLLISLGVFAAILAVDYNLFENFEDIKNFLELSLGGEASIIFMIVLAGIVELLLLNVVVFMAIILKNRKVKRASLITVIGAFLSYSLPQAAVLLVVFLLGLANPEIMSLFSNSGSINLDATKIVLLVGTGIYLASALIYNRINIKLLEKGVNVD